MKVKRSVLERIIKEELAAHLHELMEKSKEDDSTDVIDAEKEKKGKESAKPDKQGPVPPKAPPKKPEEPAADVPEEEPKELPVSDEPEADAELDQDVSGKEDDVEDAEEVTGGKISDEVTGKTIQSITMEPKSKTLPGAQELVITFREIPDPLKVLVTKTGQVKFFYKSLHNEV